MDRRSISVDPSVPAARTTVFASILLWTPFGSSRKSVRKTSYLYPEPSPFSSMESTWHRGKTSMGFPSLMAS